MNKKYLYSRKQISKMWEFGKKSYSELLESDLLATVEKKCPACENPISKYIHTCGFKPEPHKKKCEHKNGFQYRKDNFGEELYGLPMVCCDCGKDKPTPEGCKHRFTECTNGKVVKWICELCRVMVTEPPKKEEKKIELLSGLFPFSAEMDWAKQVTDLLNSHQSILNKLSVNKDSD